MRRPLNIISTHWSHDFAYAIGLLTSDGNLSPDGRHINFTSADKELVLYIRKIFSLKNKIGRKARGGSAEKNYYVLQFGSVVFYRFLLTLGLMPAKSRSLGALAIPDQFFADFVRGCFDGDGNISETKHPESRQPQLRLRISTASPLFATWLLASMQRLWHIKGGWISRDKKKSVDQVSFAKRDSIEILRHLYRYKSDYYLRRKYRKIVLYLGE